MIMQALGTVVNLTTNIGASVIIKEIVKNNTPETMSRVAKVAVPVTTALVSTLVGDKASAHFMRSVKFGVDEFKRNFIKLDEK